MFDTLKAKFKRWKHKREWPLELQVHHLRMAIQQDNRWMAHNHIAGELTERYLKILADGWEKIPQEDVSQLRSRLGLDPQQMCAVEGRMVHKGDALYWKSQPSEPIIVDRMIDGWLVSDKNAVVHPSGLTWTKGN